MKGRKKGSIQPVAHVPELDDIDLHGNAPFRACRRAHKRRARRRWRWRRGSTGGRRGPTGGRTRDRQDVVDACESRARLRPRLKVLREIVDDVEVHGVRAERGQHLPHQNGVVGNCIPYVDVALALDGPQQGALASLAQIAQHAATWEVFRQIGKLAHRADTLHLERGRGQLPNSRTSPRTLTKCLSQMGPCAGAPGLLCIGVAACFQKLQLTPKPTTARNNATSRT